MSTRRRVATVPERHAGLRLVAYLPRAFPELDRRVALDRLHAGRVALDGEAVRAAERRVPAGGRVCVECAEPDLATGDLLLLDHRLVAIAKPAGLASMRTPAGEHGAVDRATAALEIAGPLHLVHRLDRPTSGVLLLARDPATAHALAHQFAERRVDKRYLALVAGVVTYDHGTIDAPLRPASRHAGRSVVASDGQPARTAYRVLARHAQTTLLELRPQTGRRHQLRAHLAHLGHPIVGDATYGGAPAERVWLHAHSLRIELDGKGLALTAPESAPLYSKIDSSSLTPSPSFAARSR